MRRMALVPALAAALGAAAPPGGPASFQDTAGLPRSEAVYPEQRIALAFSHRRHLAEAISCTRCHGAASTSHSSGDRLVPPEAACVGCHAIEDALAGKPTRVPSACRTCHPGFDETAHRAPQASFFPRAALRFSHASHLALKIQCAECHGSFEKVDLATRDQLPKMATCLVCHDGRSARDRCDTCHPAALDARGARIQTELPGGRLRPGPTDPLGLDHGPRYERTHALAASRSRETCLACHAERSCLACHDATAKPQSVHPGDYVSSHAVPARMNQPRCDACHRRQSFCVACHERVGVGRNADAPFYVPQHRVHPPPEVWWMNPGPQHHGVQAARNIGQCASCHREEECIRCHAAGASGSGVPSGVDPHPPGFAASCRSLFAKSSRACAKCHALDEARLGPCR